MNARAIYAAAQRVLRDVTWEDSGGSQWIYVGVDSDFKKKDATTLIENHFLGEEKVFVVKGVRLVEIVNLADAAERVETLLPKRDLYLVDANCRLFLEFNSAGVARCGTIIK